MTFTKDIPVNTTGPSYQSRSKPLSVQRTQNYYAEVVEEGKEPYVLHQFPGLIERDQTNGRDRGVVRMKEIPYVVGGNMLYSWNEQGVLTEIGPIPGADRCILSNDGVNIIIVSDAGVFKYDGASITTVTDPNIIGSEAVTFLNSQMIYTKDRLFTVADPNQPDVASGLNSGAAESKPDDLVIVYAFQQNAYMFGKRSTEPWWNSGNTNPPLSRIDGQIFEVGCASKFSVANTDEFLYWLGDDSAIYQATGGTKQRISTSAISGDIESYSTTVDAIGQTFTFQGMNFYMLTFPTVSKTWCLNESLGKNGWFELSSGLDYGQYEVSSIVQAYGKLWGVGFGKLFELDINTYTNGGNPILRCRTTSSINGKLLGKPGAEVQMSKLKLLMETGRTVLSGQGENPRIMFEVSYDGGVSWVPKGWAKTGRLGQFILEVEMFNLDVFYDCIVRFSTSDPTQYSVYSATVDLRLTGRS